MNRKKRKLIIALAAVLAVTAFCLWQNNDIVVTNYVYRDAALPEGLRGLKIVQISDLHDKQFGEGQARLIAAIRKADPDIIVITGDLIDRSTRQLADAVGFASKAARIASVYYVPGNHEAGSELYEQLQRQLTGVGVTVLRDTAAIFTVGDTELEIVGLSDPEFSDSYVSQQTLDCLKDSVADEGFEIVLSHRPELMEIYKRNNAALVFAGHAHGGQIRLPFIGGLVAPHQGLFPKYDAGMYSENGTRMVVSRGLGNSIFPVRVFNRPELVVVTLD